MKEALSDALSQIEDPICRLQTDIFLRDNGLLRQPESLSGKELVVELGKAMTRDRLLHGDLVVYEGVYSCLPSLRRIRDALFSPGIHEHVNISPTRAVIIDARIPVKRFLNEVNEQVFVIRGD